MESVLSKWNGVSMNDKEEVIQVNLDGSGSSSKEFVLAAKFHSNKAYSEI